MIERLEERGTVLRDRLDAQSVAWWLVEGDPPAGWSEEEQRAFREWRGETAPPGPTPPPGAVFPAVPEGVADGLYLPQGWLQEIADLLAQRRQVVFYGPPGTGKTYIAQRLGELVESVGGSFELVQFHPAYSYEDFFRGVPAPGERDRQRRHLCVAAGSVASCRETGDRGAVQAASARH